MLVAMFLDSGVVPEDDVTALHQLMESMTSRIAVWTATSPSW